AIPKIGVEVGARRIQHGMEVEFKLPWANFPNFKPELNAVIALDAELCYSDGGPRVFRSFAYGSPLSVQQPASLGKIQLVERLEPNFWAACGPVMMPIRCDTPWAPNTKTQLTGYIALPPDQAATHRKAPSILTTRLTTTRAKISAHSYTTHTTSR